MAVTPAGVRRMLAYFRWYRYAQPPAIWLASLRLAGEWPATLVERAVDLLTYMNRQSLRVLLLLLLGAVWLRAEPTPLDSSCFNKSDGAFFFDSISYDHGEWHFELSRNSMGMMWRTIDGKQDVTGVCNYRQTLIVPKSSSLEMKAPGISILFQPFKPGALAGAAAYNVWKRIGPRKQPLASALIVRGDGSIEIDSGSGE